MKQIYAQNIKWLQKQAQLKTASKVIPCGTISALVGEEKDAHAIGSSKIFGIIITLKSGQQFQINALQLKNTGLIQTIENELLI